MIGATGLLARADESEANLFPRQLTVHSYAKSGDYHYYGSSDGLWRRTDWHEADEADRLWGKPNQAVTGAAVWGDTVVVAAGGTLALGSVENGSSWREVPAAAIAPRPAGPWEEVRLLAWRFVARAGKYYTSRDGEKWEALATGDRVAVGVGGAGDRLWCVASQPDRSGHVLGRSEDGRTWTWSGPLPENFKPEGGFFAVLEDGTAVLAGSANAGKSGAPAILSYAWPQEGAVRWQLFVHGPVTPAGRIALAQTNGGVWATLPKGDVAASVTGFDWMHFAANPLGTAKTWLLTDGTLADEVMLATEGGRHVIFYDEQVEHAGRGGAAEIAWQEVKGSTPAPAAASAVPAGLVPGALPAQTKQIVAAGGKYLAITWAKNGLWAAEPGGPWRNVAAFGQQVNSIAAVGDRALAVVDYTGVLLWDAAAGRSLPVEPPPAKSFGTVHAANGRFFGISSAGHLFELGDEGRWRQITLPSDDPNFGVQSLVYHAGHYLVSPVRESGLYRTADFQNWTHAPMKGGNTRTGRLFDTGRRLLAVQHHGSRDKDATPVELAVSTDGVAWQEIEGIVTARDSYFRGVLHDGRRHVLVFTRELWVSEGDEAQVWRRMPVEPDSHFDLTNGRLVAATVDGLMVQDAGTLTFAEPSSTRVARSLATATSWQAAGPVAVAERKKQEALAKAAAEAIPPTVAGAVEMAKAFHHFERLYVSGAPRRELVQQVVGVHEAVRKHRPQLADEVAEVLSVLVVNLEVRDARTTAFLAHHLPGFRQKVQARYGKAYSQIYWSLRRQPSAAPTQQEYEVDVMKELLMSHTDNSYLRRVTFPKVPQGYPNYDADKPRPPVEFAAVPDAPFDAAEMQKNLVEKGWAGAALDRDVMHANKLQIEASTAMRHVWLLAARALWPGTPPAGTDDLLKRSKEEKARMGSLFATDGLALDARKAGRAEDFARYRDLAVQRGMQASRYVSYAQMMAENLKVMNEVTANISAAMQEYNEGMGAATADLEQLLQERDRILAGSADAPAKETGSPFLTDQEQRLQAIGLGSIEAMPAGEARDKALAEHHAKWDEKLKYRRLAVQLARAADLRDDEATGFLRTAALRALDDHFRDLYGKTPAHSDNGLVLVNLLSVAQNKVTREKKSEILDQVLRDVPTLADVWALRAELHAEDGEREKAEGKLAVARHLDAKNPAVVRVAGKWKAREQPAPTKPGDALDALLRDAHERSIQRVKDGDAAFARGSFSTAKNGWSDAAQAGNPEASLRLALLYAEGMGMAKDLPGALGWAEKAKGSPQTKARAETLERNVRVLMQADVPARDAQQARAGLFQAVGLARPTVDPDADFQRGRDFEEGRQGATPLERQAGAITAYRRASDSDHVPATLALVRLLNAHLEVLVEQDEGDDDHGRRRQKELVDEIKQRVLQAARLGSGEAMRVHALWIAQGEMGGDAQANAVLALIKLEAAAEAGDLIAMRLLIRAAQAGEWKPPTADTVEKLVQKLADAGEADAKALIQQRDQQKSFDREYWGERGAPVADPKAVSAAVPTEMVVLNGAPRSLVVHLQLARPAATTARSFEAARALVIAMLGDERIDPAERAFLGEVVKPSFRVKVVAPADGQGPAREVVFLGSYQPQARALLERFIPPAGSDQPAMTPLMRRYFWIWTGVNGWKRAITHAGSGPAGRREMIDVLKGWLGEKWSASNTANNFGPLRDELASFKNTLAQLKGADYALGRGLLLESCQELDKASNDAVPDFLYAEFKDMPPGNK